MSAVCPVLPVVAFVLMATAACTATSETLTPTRTLGIGQTSGHTPTPAPTPTQATARFPGYGLPLAEGTFWTYRWTYEETSCAQGSGCSKDEDDGEFNVILGAQGTIGGVTLHEVEVSGDSAVRVEGAARDFAPRWRYMGVDGNRVVASDGAAIVTLFDAATGVWAGSGFFTDRFTPTELVEASSIPIDDAYDFAARPGFEPGPAEAVGRSSSQSQCEMIAGMRICPREDSFSGSEREFYRAGVGPLAYTYDFSASFSGGGFFSSSTSRERVALVATSLRGDVLLPTPTPTPTPAPATHEVEPNDDLDRAQLLTIGVALAGDVAIGDAALGPSAYAEVGTVAYTVGAEDHYRFELAQASPVRIWLRLDSGVSSETIVGLVLWDSAGADLGYIFQASESDLALTGDLPAGAYTVGVVAFDLPAGRVRYTIEVVVEG